jgi:hypothetical protein
MSTRKQKNVEFSERQLSGRRRRLELAFELIAVNQLQTGPEQHKYAMGRTVERSYNPNTQMVLRGHKMVVADYRNIAG